MLDRDKVRGLTYLIIAGTILAFLVLMSSSETFGQLSTFSGSGGFGYPGSFYGGYSGYSYPGYVSWSGPFAYSQDSSQWVPLYQYSPGPGPGIPNPFNPIYGLVPPGYGPLWASTHYSVPSWIINMMAYSRYSPSEPDIAQIGYQLSLPYFLSDVMRGWRPWSIPYSYPQTYYKYGPISPISGAPIGMAYNPLSGSFYIPGS